MKILITGGAGFIGINTAKYYLKKGDEVFILDNLSRKGSEINLAWLKKFFPKVKSIKGDVRNFNLLKKAVLGKDVIFHFAGQVTVTNSVKNPREDFDINILGTLNLLEAVRLVNRKAILVYSSTNKVYGSMLDEEIVEEESRYSYKNLKHGIPETYPLDFHSPYGCSKGSADQYVRDYARIYDLNTIVFRQSCIYGPNQFGVEDQGWIAWFVIAALFNKQITIYGNGKQVRDILFIDDLIEGFELAIKSINKTKGQIYNIGGGNEFSISIWKEFKPLLEKLMKRTINESYSDWRPGDQKIYISDTKKAAKEFNWKPSIKLKDGIEELVKWMIGHKDVLGAL